MPARKFLDLSCVLAAWFSVEGFLPAVVGLLSTRPAEWVVLCPLSLSSLRPREGVAWEGRLPMSCVRQGLSVHV